MRLPKQVEIIEVGPRDGFQNVRDFIETPQKIAIVDALAEAGFGTMEVTSFVHPKAIPQMADAEAVLTHARRKYAGRMKLAVLVPNLFGARKAVSLAVDEMSYVISASERHNLENTRQTVDQSLQALKEVLAEKGQVKLRLSVATAFACPFLGKTPLESVARIIDAGLEMGVDDIMIADTIGTANPLHVEELLTYLQQRYPGQAFVMHVHDTRGMGLANCLKALEMGVHRFESSAGGLGGCPFAPGAAGNIATVDLVNMLHEMKLSTGIDADKLLEAVRLIADTVRFPLESHTAKTRQIQHNH